MEQKKENIINPEQHDNVDVKKEDTKKSKDKKDEKKEKKVKRPAKVVLKTWSHGLSKEASRITWENKKDVLKDFITIIIVSIIFAVIFFAIDMIIVTIRK